MRVNKSLCYKTDLGECFSLVLPRKMNPSAEAAQQPIKKTVIKWYFTYPRFKV